MVFVFLFLFEFIFLFFLSRLLTRRLFFLPINLISFLFLPGIIIHELAHLLTASLLFVPVGDIEFMPEVGEGGLKLGSVSIGKTDPIRRFLIGVAPVIFGAAVIFGLLYFIELNKFTGFGVWLGVSYILFAVGNTMFSSGKDMEGALILLIFIVIISIALFLTGFRIPSSFFESSFFINSSISAKQADLYLGFLIGIDASVYLLTRVLRR